MENGLAERGDGPYCARSCQKFERRLSRTNRLFDCTGSVAKLPYPTNRRVTKKLTDPVKLVLLHTVIESPQLYLREIQSKIMNYTGVDVSPALICNFLKEMHFSRQRMKIVAKQRDEQL